MTRARRALGVAVVLVSLAAGLAVVRGAASWTAASVEYPLPVPAVDQLRVQLAEEQARADQLQAQLDELMAASADLAGALDDAGSRMASNAGTADALRGSLAAARGRLAVLQQALAAAGIALPTRIAGP